MIPVGELVTTHGILGWLKLHPYNPRTDVLFSVQTIYLQKGTDTATCVVEGCKAFKKDFLLKLIGTNSILEAKRWVGSIVAVAETDLRPLEAGEYYCHQILGFDVFDNQGQWLGKVARIWAKEGGDLYVVTGSEKEYLIPAAGEIIEKVDLAKGKIVINPPPGLLDL
ncbi:MAG: ribosome maturation factor RimM [Candidatus Binatia bacterium]